MSNRVYPEVVEIYENEKHLVYLYEIYRNGEKRYYLSIGLKGDFRQKIESKTFPADYSREYIESWLKSKIGAFRKCEVEDESSIEF